MKLPSEQAPRRPTPQELRDRQGLIEVWNKNLDFLGQYSDDAQIVIRSDHDRVDGEHFTKFLQIHVGQAKRYVTTQLEKLSEDPATGSTSTLVDEEWSEASERPPGAKVEKVSFQM